MADAFGVPRYIADAQRARALAQLISISRPRKRSLGYSTSAPRPGPTLIATLAFLAAGARPPWCCWVAFAIA
jgi:hypothetical protein